MTNFEQLIYDEIKELKADVKILMAKENRREGIIWLVGLIASFIGTGIGALVSKFL